MSEETSAEGQGARVIPLDPAQRTAQQRQKRSKDEEANLVARLNKDFAYVPEGRDDWVYREWRDPQRKGRYRLDKFSIPAFKRMFGNRIMTVEREDPRHPGQIKQVPKTWSDIWLSHPNRRQFLGGTIFDPTGKAPKHYWNLWKGFAVTPVKNPSAWAKMKDHIYEVLAGGNEKAFDYILNWSALLLQHPERHVEVALVFRGEEEGLGKGLFVEALLRMLGQHGLQLHHQEHVKGKFNAHMHQLVLLYINEAFYAGDRQFEAFLKGITSDSEIGIEGKNRDLFQALNYLHTVMSSNRDWVVPASLTSRRWALFDVSDKRLGDRAYFRALANAMMKGGGDEAMLYELLHRNIEFFEVRDFPKTAALVRQRLLSLEILPRWWMQVLTRGYVYASRFGAPSLQWAEFHTMALLTAGFNQWCKEIGQHQRATEVQIGEFMTAAGYLAGRHKGPYPLGERDWLPSAPGGFGGTGDPRQGQFAISELERHEEDAPASPAFVQDWRDGAVIRDPNRRHPGYWHRSLDEARAVFKQYTRDLPMPWDAAG
jgi:hypothetical protein